MENRALCLSSSLRRFRRERLQHWPRPFWSTIRNNCITLPHFNILFIPRLISFDQLPFQCYHHVLLFSFVSLTKSRYEILADKRPCILPTVSFTRHVQTTPRTRTERRKPTNRLRVLVVVGIEITVPDLFRRRRENKHRDDRYPVNVDAGFRSKTCW